MLERICQCEITSSWLQRKLLPWWKIYGRKSGRYWLVLTLSCIAMLTAFPASSILTRLYYQDGGKRRWLISWVATAGWPLTALALLPFYTVKGISPTPLNWQLFFSYAVGIITAATVLLALDSSSDRPDGVSKKQYVVGFILDLGGSALHGLIFALSELMFIKFLGRNSIHLVLEQQAMVSFFGCIFTTIGVIINGDFSVLKSESRGFRHGPVSYYMVLIWATVTFQMGVLGGVAVLYQTSTLLAGVLNAARVPVTSIAAVIFLHDPMGGFKILALLLTIWGFGSYIYGGFTEVQNDQSATVTSSQDNQLSDRTFDGQGQLEDMIA